MSWDYDPHEPPPAAWPGPLALLVLALIFAIAILCTGCAADDAPRAIPVEDGPDTRQIIDPVMGPNFGVAQLPRIHR